jgi:hypothetical protein
MSTVTRLYNNNKFILNLPFCEGRKTVIIQAKSVAFFGGDLNSRDKGMMKSSNCICSIILEEDMNKELRCLLNPRYRPNPFKFIDPNPVISVIKDSILNVQQGISIEKPKLRKVRESKVKDNIPQI